MHVCRSQQQASPASYRCAAAAAATLEDLVCGRCHEARVRLRLYDTSRLQLLEAAALDKLAAQQEREAQKQQRQRQLQVQQPRQLGPQQRQQQQEQEQEGAAFNGRRQAGGALEVQQVASAGVAAAGNDTAAAPAPAVVQGQDAAVSAGTQLQVPRADQESQACKQLDVLRARAAAVLSESFERSSVTPAQHQACCPWAAAYGGFQKLWRTLNLVL